MNRLARERSPYLLQHAENPVDWFAWDREAFDKAAAENKPIFLSIGYSTCHWCHVMAHESFEDRGVAELLNEHFVSIKVDREERPDVDRVYMTFVQATTGSGGWPMSVWLTPELKPFYGGTYFPPSTRWGRPGFMEVLQEIARVWRADGGKVRESAEAMTSRLREVGRAAAGAPDVPGAAALSRIVGQFHQTFDWRHSGFGDAPKFPRPSELLFLLREHKRTGDKFARDMSLRTLKAMAEGGMRDHVGGGFHRYSVDAAWRVPHFEKMLYDQAQLTLAYVEAAQASGDRFFLDVAEDTLHYVMRQMTDEGGGFYSAEDADSVPPERAGEPHPHKMEGAFYLWRADELEDLLGADARIVELRFGIERNGNAPQDPQQEFVGKNLLYQARTIDEIAQRTDRPADEIEPVLRRARVRMFEAQLHRPRPHLDDKVLTAWNGLMIAAFARTARILPGFTDEPAPGTPAPGTPAPGTPAPGTPAPGTPAPGTPAPGTPAPGTPAPGTPAPGTLAPGTLAPGTAGTRHHAYLFAAQRAASFIRDRLWNPSTATLLRRYRDGHADIEAYAEDYAYLIWGLIELFEADGDPAWLEWAIALQRRQDALFWDDRDAGWFSTTGRDETVLLRMKEDYDGAEPTASSVSVMNLLRLGHLIENADWDREVDRTLRAFGPRLEQMGRAVPMMAAALSTMLAGIQQIVLVGSEQGRTSFARIVARHYLPFAITINVSEAHRDRLSSLLPFIAGMRGTPAPGTPAPGTAAAYICRNFACEAPISDATRVEQALAGDAS